MGGTGTRGAGKVLSLREEDFVQAAAIAGSKDGSIIVRHILPSFFSYLIVHVTLAVPRMFLGETALSFLGLGLQTPVVSWGVLLSEGQNVQTIAIHPWMVPLDPADPIHGDACRELAAAAVGGEPEDDLYYDCPALRRVVQRPELRGALASLLGSGYRLFTHRHGHVTPPAAEGAGGSQRPHQDGSFRRFVGWSRPWRRHHRPRVLLAFYYPHEVTAELGPTGIAPGSHYYRHLHDRYDHHEMHLVLPAGTVALCHPHLWHRATVNRGSRPRFMVKLLFRRHGDPVAPSWPTGPGAGTFASAVEADGPGRELYRHPLIWQALWGWLRGEDARGVTAVAPRPRPTRWTRRTGSVSAMIRPVSPRFRRR